MCTVFQAVVCSIEFRLLLEDNRYERLFSANSSPECLPLSLSGPEQGLRARRLGRKGSCPKDVCPWFYGADAAHEIGGGKAAHSMVGCDAAHAMAGGEAAHAMAGGDAVHEMAGGGAAHAMADGLAAHDGSRVRWDLDGETWGPAS